MFGKRKTPPELSYRLVVEEEEGKPSWPRLRSAWRRARAGYYAAAFLSAGAVLAYAVPAGTVPFLSPGGRASLAGYQLAVSGLIVNMNAQRLVRQDAPAVKGPPVKGPSTKGQPTTGQPATVQETPSSAEIPLPPRNPFRP